MKIQRLWQIDKEKIEVIQGIDRKKRIYGIKPI